MSVLPISTTSAPISEALELAKAECQPFFVPSAMYTDDRGWSLMNQLAGAMSPAGQINYSHQYPGVVKAWHRHEKQTDFWLCVSGHIKVGVHRDDGQSWSLVIGEKRPGVVVITPPLWHGAATVGPTGAGLLYYVTHQYDPADPDEQRRDYDSVSGFNWGVEQR